MHDVTATEILNQVQDDKRGYFHSYVIAEFLQTVKRLSGTQSDKQFFFVIVIFHKWLFQ